MQPTNLKEKIKAVRDACKRGTCGHTYAFECCQNHGNDMWCTECLWPAHPYNVRLDDGRLVQGVVIGDVELFERIMASQINEE